MWRNARVRQKGTKRNEEYMWGQLRCFSSCSLPSFLENQSRGLPFDLQLLLNWFTDQWFSQIVWKNNFRNTGKFGWILRCNIGELWMTYSPGQANPINYQLPRLLVFVSLDLAPGDSSSLLLSHSLSSVNLWMNRKRGVKYVAFIYRLFHYFYIFN